MAESYGTDQKPNGDVEVTKEDGGGGGAQSGISDGKDSSGYKREEEATSKTTLYAVLHRLITAILFPDQAGSDATLIQRIKTSLSENAPLIPEATRNTGRHILSWTRRGSPLRALLVISVGTITLVALTGLVIFMLFFLTATINAVIISLLMSLAAAGGFLALFFASLTAIYIGAIAVAMLVIGFTTFWTIVAVVIATGWIGFFWTVWFATKKSVELAKHSLKVTGSVVSNYSSALHSRQRQYDASG